MATPPPGFRYIDVHTHLPMPVYEKIFHDNAARLLGHG